MSKVLVNALQLNIISTYFSRINSSNEFLILQGLLQMRFLPRLRYILEVCRPSAPTVSNILDILIRIARHSTEAAHCVAKCPRLLETVVVQFVPTSWKLRERSTMLSDVYGHPLPKALKLFRVLCCSGKYLADTLVSWDHRLLKVPVA